MSGLTGSNSAYAPDQAVVFTGQDMALIRAAFEQIMEDSQTPVFVNKFKFFDPKKDEYVDAHTVTEEDLKSGKILKIHDTTESFKTSNILLGIDANTITPIVREAYLTVISRYEIDARQGKTISIEEYKAKYVKESGESKTKVEEDGE